MQLECQHVFSPGCVCFNRHLARRKKTGLFRLVLSELPASLYE